MSIVRFAIAVARCECPEAEEFRVDGVDLTNDGTAHVQLTARLAPVACAVELTVVKVPT